MGKAAGRRGSILGVGVKGKWNPRARAVRHGKLRGADHHAVGGNRDALAPAGELSSLQEGTGFDQAAVCDHIVLFRGSDGKLDCGLVIRVIYGREPVMRPVGPVLGKVNVPVVVVLSDQQTLSVRPAAVPYFHNGNLMFIVRTTEPDGDLSVPVRERALLPVNFQCLHRHVFKIQPHLRHTSLPHHHVNASHPSYRFAPLGELQCDLVMDHVYLRLAPVGIRPCGQGE